MSSSKREATSASKTIVLRRERELRPHCFQQIEGEGAPRRIPLRGTELLIGRADDAAIQVPSKRASRRHAILKQRGTDFVIHDNDSDNGLFLNGVKINSAILRDGDIIQVADCAFIYREG